MNDWATGDRVMVYTNLGRLGKAVILKLWPTTVSGNELPYYMKVRMDNGGLELHVKASLCKRLIKK